MNEYQLNPTGIGKHYDIFYKDYFTKYSIFYKDFKLNGKRKIDGNT